MGLLAILVSLGLLIFLAYRGWSILLLAPAAALIAAGLSGQPLLAHWTQTFMTSAAQFIMQFFPIFLLGALFGKLMEDSGSVTAIAAYMTEPLSSINFPNSAPSRKIGKNCMMNCAALAMNVWVQCASSGWPDSSAAIIAAPGASSKMLQPR